MKALCLAQAQRTTGRRPAASDGPRDPVQLNVPPPVLHVPSPVLAVLSMRMSQLAGGRSDHTAGERIAQAPDLDPATLVVEVTEANTRAAAFDSERQLKAEHRARHDGRLPPVHAQIGNLVEYRCGRSTAHRSLARKLQLSRSPDGRPPRSPRKSSEKR